MHEVEQVNGFLLNEPVAVAAVHPVGKIWGVDWLTVELFFEDGVDFLQRVKPGDEFCTWLAILDAAVEFFADLVRKAGDFSCSGHRKPRFNG